MRDLIIKSSGGANIVIRPQAIPQWRPAATTDPVSVEVWACEVGKPLSEAFKVGDFAPGSTGSIPYNPDTDRNLRLFTVSRSASGVPGVSRLEDGEKLVALFQRETAAPQVGQVGAATAEKITVGVDGFSRFARKRKLRTADNAAMNDASVIIRDSDSYIDRELPRYIEILRSAGIVADFSWTGNDPAANGFTKNGTGTTQASGNAWRINTTGSDGQTYYTKNNFPANAFVNGFTLEITVPTVTATDAANPADCIAVRVENGVKRYELTFDADEVKLNGGASRALGTNTKVRLVIAPGGATADLWIGDVLTEDNTAGVATSTAGLSFGDLAGADDADVNWKRIEYALTPQIPRLAQTIYVGVSHSSGGSFGAESTIASFTFANEQSGTGGSIDDFDPTPRDKFYLE